MTYDIAADRMRTREQCVGLVRDHGPGVDSYALDKAESLVREDPTLHDGLVEAVKNELGPQRLRGAVASLNWFRGEKRRTR